jgi:hypothetical protein
VPQVCCQPLINRILRAPYTTYQVKQRVMPPFQPIHATRRGWGCCWEMLSGLLEFKCATRWRQTTMTRWLPTHTWMARMC